jgi:hypothetical protein
VSFAAPLRVLALAGAAALLSWTAPAGARLEVSSPYTKAQTYSGALRYLRVDLGYEVVERDPDAAYLIFQFVPSGKSAATHGSIEVIEVEDQIRVIVQLPELPEYREAMLRDGLVTKLATEYGAPPPRPRGDAPDSGSAPREGDGKEPPSKTDDADRGSDTDDDQHPNGDRPGAVPTPSAPDGRQDGRRRARKSRR